MVSEEVEWKVEWREAEKTASFKVEAGANPNLDEKENQIITYIMYAYKYMEFILKTWLKYYRKQI